MPDETQTAERTEGIRWLAHAQVRKYHTPDGTPSPEVLESMEPYEVLERDGNLLLIGGASALWERLIATAMTAFDNTNAYLGVGDSSTAAVDTQTDLVAASNKLRKAMDATYPQHTDTTGTAGSKTITYRSTFATGDANWVWAEWGLFNAAAAGRMLNRKVDALGTKTSASTWVLTITLTLA